MDREFALDPNDLARFFVERGNAGDVEGLVALYEANAIVAGANGEVIIGTEAIRAFYTQVLAGRPQFKLGEQRPALRQGDLALTSTRLANGTVTAEIARQQPDGNWLWAVDQPVIARVLLKLYSVIISQRGLETKWSQKQSTFTNLKSAYKSCSICLRRTQNCC